MVPEEGKKYVLESVNECWHVYKSRVKKIHFYKMPVELRWSNRPNGVPDDQFKNLLDYWNDPAVEVFIILVIFHVIIMSLSVSWFGNVISCFLFYCLVLNIELLCMQDIFW